MFDPRLSPTEACDIFDAACRSTPSDMFDEAKLKRAFVRALLDYLSNSARSHIYDELVKSDHARD